MLLSVFTPTHKPDYLRHVWACLLRQDFKDWEWIVAPNGPQSNAICKHLEELTAKDLRVHVFPAPGNVEGVGALKKFCCTQAKGDAFFEYDHDDLLTDDCFSTVVATLRQSPKKCFLYSDNVTMSFDGQSHKFNPAYGWRHYTWEHKGKTYTINTSFPPNARTLCEILYAPDHIRVWTREAYNGTGGHNPKLAVGDDHELVVRTYLSGAAFVHIPRPLYFHRLNEETTSQKNLPVIDKISRSVRDKYLHALVLEWSKRENFPLFDLGGFHNCPDGYIPLDRSFAFNSKALEGMRNRIWPTQVGGDIFTALRYIPNNSVGCFRAVDFLEHVPIGKVTELMNTLYEKLVPGGFLLTHTPAVCDDEGRCGRGAYQDPDHKSFWSSNNFWYYTDKKFAGYQNGDVKCRFQSVRLGNYYPSEWHKSHLIPYVVWDGMALKDDESFYYPGPKNI